MGATDRDLVLHLVDEDPIDPAQPFGMSGFGDVFLDRSQMTETLHRDVARNLIFHRRRRGARFGRVWEEPGPVETGLDEEIGQLVDLLVGLAGKADDERRSQGGVRLELADPPNEGEVLVEVPGPLHPTEQRAGDMLEGEVEIRRHDVVGGHLDEEALAYLSGMQIEQSEALQTGDIGEKHQELG